MNNKTYGAVMCAIIVGVAIAAFCAVVSSKSGAKSSLPTAAPAGCLPIRITQSADGWYTVEQTKANGEVFEWDSLRTLDEARDVATFLRRADVEIMQFRARVYADAVKRERASSRTLVEEH